MSELIPDLLVASASQCSDRTAVIFDGVGEMTYGAWEAQSDRLGRHLVNRGIRPVAP